MAAMTKKGHFLPSAPATKAAEDNLALSTSNMLDLVRSVVSDNLRHTTFIRSVRGANGSHVDINFPNMEGDLCDAVLEQRMATRKQKKVVKHTIRAAKRKVLHP